MLPSEELSDTIRRHFLDPIGRGNDFAPAGAISSTHTNASSLIRSQAGLVGQCNTMQAGM
jgi:hypothetical protein